MSDEKHARAETGAMQFGDDWPGVFIRGDNAAYYAMQLQAALDAAEDAVRDPIAVAVLRGLVSELNGCRVTGDGTPPATQHLCAFGDALRASSDATARVAAAARALRAAAAAEIAAEDTVTSDRAAADARIIAILDARTAGEKADVELDAALAALDARDGATPPCPDCGSTGAHRRFGCATRGRLVAPADAPRDGAAPADAHAFRLRERHTWQRVLAGLTEGSEER